MRCKDKCGENEGEARAKLNYPAKTITAMISICTAQSNEKRLEGKWDLSPLLCLFCALPKRLFGCSRDLLCWNILKSIMERSIDLPATSNWLCSARRTEILILILHSAAISQHLKNKAITQRTFRERKLHCRQIQQTPESREVWPSLITDDDEETSFNSNANPSVYIDLNTVLNSVLRRTTRLMPLLILICCICK